MQAFDQNGTIDRSSVAWSCVLDDTRALWDHFLVWIATLTDGAGVPPEAIVVHHVTNLRHDVARLASGLGLKTQLIPRFDARSPHSNKILQCLSDFGRARRVVLTDVDLAFLVRPPVECLNASVAGKSVDFANPPYEVLCDLFRHAHLPIPNDRSTAAVLDPAGVLHEFQTFPANYNGGFYVIDCAVLAEVGSRWAHWALWLLDASLIPAQYAVHVDQISFCMAVHELGLDTVTLDAAWNLPSHVLTVPSDTPPFIVHHHGQLDESLQLLQLRPPRHEASIAAVNAVISGFLQRHGIVPAAHSR